MRILVTGSEGNIGRVFIPYLKISHDVFRVDQVQGIGDDYRVADINSPVELSEVFEMFKPEVVYHMAAMVSRVTCEASPSLTIKSNVSGTANVAQLCRMYNAKMIYFSTSEVYGNIEGELREDREDIKPNNIYGLSKLLGEHVVRYETTKGLRAITVRPFMFYHESETVGTHRSAVIRFASNLLKKQQITVHKGSSRSWMHLDDAVEILEKLKGVNQYQVINICNPDIWQTIDVAKVICSELGLDYRQYVIEKELPKRMTLTKNPCFIRQTIFTGKRDMIPLTEGVKRVIEWLM